MSQIVHRHAVPDAEDFIDAVGELVAAVLDMDLRLLLRQVATVDVCNVRHAGIVNYLDMSLVAVTIAVIAAMAGIG